MTLVGDGLCMTSCRLPKDPGPAVLSAVLAPITAVVAAI
jgi:hypothetical protein